MQEQQKTEKTYLFVTGSRLNNGDAIAETLQDAWGIEVRDRAQIPGPFVPSYTPSWGATHGGSAYA